MLINKGFARDAQNIAREIVARSRGLRDAQNEKFG
jgi:hypothetical protein